MPEAEADATLRLPARLDAPAAAALYRQVAPRAAALRAIDFRQVQWLDSAGVALVRALAAAATRAGGAPPQLIAPPPRWRQLCLAHRVPPGDTGP